MMTHIAGTVPYPWPFDGQVRASATALVVCGAQSALVDVCPTSTAVLGRIVEAARRVREAGGSVIWVRHGSRGGPRRRARHLPLRGSVGWDLAVRPDLDDLVVDAAGWDGCYGSDLDHSVRALGVRAVALAGIASEVTVDSTVRALNDRGHECLVLTDACAPIDADLGARAHASLTMSGGIFGALGATNQFIAAILKETA